MTAVLVVGAGSIGARHARNLMAASGDVSVMDPELERSQAIAGATAVAFDLDHMDGYDGIVIASPTVCHHSQTVAALRTGARLLVEKPLALPDEPLDDVLAQSDRVMVGYNLRFHDPVVRLIERVHSGAVGTVRTIRLWFGSWLPDWRPAVDYRSTYSAQRSLGGGVLLDAIHELDILLWLLGDADLDVRGAFVGRVGSLEIDVDDTVKALLVHRTGVVVEVSLDYLSRRYRRGIEVVGDDATIRLDWARQVLEIEDADTVTSERADDPVDRSYEREAHAFLGFVTGDVRPPVDAVAGAASLDIARRILAASSS